MKESSGRNINDTIRPAVWGAANRKRSLSLKVLIVSATALLLWVHVAGADLLVGYDFEDLDINTSGSVPDIGVGLPINAFLAPGVMVVNDHQRGRVCRPALRVMVPRRPITEKRQRPGSLPWHSGWTTQQPAASGGIPPRTTPETMAIKDMGPWESIYCTTADMTPTVVRELARHAEAHIYSETGDTFYVNKSYAYLHANSAGSCNIQFPQNVDIYDTLTKTLLASGVASYNTTYSNGETRIFRYVTNP